MHATLCSGIKADGTTCRAVAVTGSRLCRSHKKLNQRTRRMHRIRQIPGTRRGPLPDRPAILRAVSRITQAMASGSLNPDRATTLFNRIRQSSDALRKPSRTGSRPLTAESRS